MSISNPSFFGGTALSVGLAGLCLFNGCGSVRKQPEAAGPVFFPAAPEKPRLQFLTSFSGSADLGAAGASGFEKFVLGEAEQKEGIITPYGLAIFDGKLYVCDVGKRRVEVLDLKKRTFGYMTEDRRLANPVNIFIESTGTKYVADPTAGAVFVFDAGNVLKAILGKDLRISPIDVTVRGPCCYVTDFASNRVVVMDKTTGKEIRRMGEQGEGEKQFKLISDLAFGPDDKFLRAFGQQGDRPGNFAHPCGVAVDRAGNIYVTDRQFENVQVFGPEGHILMAFGQEGHAPGEFWLPVGIFIDDGDRVYVADSYNKRIQVFESLKEGGR